MVETFVFDFNGTMIFDAELQYESWERVLETTFKKKITKSDFQHHVAGRNNRYTFNYFSEESLSNDDIRSLSATKESLYRKICLDRPDKFHLVSGLTDFLDRAVVAKKKLNIATASEKENVQFFFEYLNLAKWFNSDLVVINDGTLPGKPAPDMFLKAIHQVGGVPASSVIFEDSPSGIRAANNGRVAQTILVVDPDFSEPNFEDDIKISNKITTYGDLLTESSLL